MKTANVIFSILVMAMAIHTAGCTIQSNSTAQTQSSEISTTTDITEDYADRLVVETIIDKEQSEVETLEEGEVKIVNPFEDREFSNFAKFEPFYFALGILDLLPDDFRFHPAKNDSYQKFLSDVYGGEQANYEQKNYYETRIIEGWNLFTFIKYTDIDPSYIREALSTSSTTDTLNQTYFELTESQIDALMLLDEERVLQEFATEWCIVKGTNFYTGAWLHDNDVDAYEKAGLTAEEIFEILKLCRTLPYFEGEFMEQKLCQYAQKTGSSLTTEEICGYDRDLNMPQPLYDISLKYPNKFLFKNVFSTSTGYYKTLLCYLKEYLWYGYVPIGQNTTLNFDVTDKAEVETVIEKEDYSGKSAEILRSGDAEKIIHHFTQGNNTVLIKGDHFYSFAWVYYSKPETYLIEGLTPDELISALPKYEELDILTDEAMTALKNKLYSYKESYEAER